jgi:hypothetical protein
MRAGRAFNDLAAEPSEIRTRFQRRGLVFDAVEQLARAIAGGINLNWWEMGADSQAMLRAEAQAMLARFGRPLS